MEFRDAHTVSEKVHGQVDQVCRVWLKHLKHRLVGVYLHGSSALGSFVEDASDLDILVVTEARLSRRERLSIARDVLAIDQKALPSRNIGFVAATDFPLAVSHTVPVPLQQPLDGALSAAVGW